MPLTSLLCIPRSRNGHLGYQKSLFMLYTPPERSSYTYVILSMPYSKPRTVQLKTRIPLETIQSKQRLQEAFETWGRFTHYPYNQGSATIGGQFQDVAECIKKYILSCKLLFLLKGTLLLLYNQLELIEKTIFISQQQVFLYPCLTQICSALLISICLWPKSSFQIN